MNFEIDQEAHAKPIPSSNIQINCNQQPYMDKTNVIQPQINPFSQPNPFQNDEILYVNARLNFIRKVYTILSVQLIITLCIILCSMYSSSFFYFQIYNYWLLYVSLGIVIICQILIFFCKVGTIYPYNLMLLFIFTVAEAYIISFICAVTGKQSGNIIVLVAIVMTAAVVVGCTIYAFTTRVDFQTKFGVIIIVALGLLFFGIFGAIFQNTIIFPLLYDMYCTLGVILCGVFIIIDTQMIAGGQRQGISLDDYVAGALILYLDIIRLLLFILRLFGRK